jgi:hypothetical protein
MEDWRIQARREMRIGACGPVPRVRRYLLRYNAPYITILINVPTGHCLGYRDPQLVVSYNPP